MRWFFLLLLLANGVVYLAVQSENGFELIADRVVSMGREGNIVLLSERDLVASEPLSDIDSDIDSEVHRDRPVLAEGECLVLGPIIQLPLVSELQAKNSDLRIYSDEYERGADYWVHLGPYNSFAAASKVSAELRSKRIDNFVIRKGELKNAVSLGVFTDAERAATHAKGLAKKRYTAEIRRISKLATRYWLVFNGGDASVDYGQVEAEMAVIADDNKKLAKKSCNLIASYKRLD
ncbi:SPOR domain-containing protein [Zhongshania borealis]|uniref:SPOR domain-containing protein n=1 Tax=Zhongshania borealis TaxID=889488 RepID=A0ABP7WXK0_9GAMM